eukprot:Mycagemm_TRINITY_DN10306_c1_g3::TRINITY_DN10306_c1_g3_i1::g.1180::m.1180 type:complete len:117 gc:universal TRINITY_DN10306_c1_g3_i1:1282-1632(+)
MSASLYDFSTSSSSSASLSFSASAGFSAAAGAGAGVGGALALSFRPSMRFSSFSSHSLSGSASSTDCKGVLSSPATSCSTCRMRIYSGMLRSGSREEIFRSITDLPNPLRPIIPYL